MNQILCKNTSQKKLGIIADNQGNRAHLISRKIGLAILQIVSRRKAERITLKQRLATNSIFHFSRLKIAEKMDGNGPIVIFNFSFVFTTFCWSCSPPVAEYALVVNYTSFDCLLSSAGLGHLGKG